MNNYLKTPLKIQFELSSMCNALCLGCVRTDTTNFNQSKSLIPKKQLVEVSTFKKLISDPLMSTVKELEFCGTIDEPLMYPHFFEILEIAFEINPNYIITIHTNGSIRSESEWKNLAVILKKFKSKHRVQFSIDGLSDTHEIYRQQTSYDKIIKNAVSFINEGGNAHWQFLVFPWNSHQIDEAKKISKDLKFSEFIVRHDRSLVTTYGIEKIKILKKKNRTQVTNSKNDIADLIESFRDIQDVEISCFNQDNGMYFLSFDSKLWPCCFISNGFLRQQSHEVNFLNERLYKNYGKDFNDLTVKSVEEILSTDFYKNDLVESWNNTVSTSPCGKITRCAETCNVKKLKALPIGNHRYTKNE